MLNEYLQAIIEVSGHGNEWPVFYVVTDRDVYRFDWDKLIRWGDKPAGRNLLLSANYLGKLIVSATTSGDVSDIVLANGGVIAFDLNGAIPTDDGPQTWPNIRFDKTLDEDDSLDDSVPLPVVVRAENTDHRK